MSKFAPLFFTPPMLSTEQKLTLIFEGVVGLRFGSVWMGGLRRNHSNGQAAAGFALYVLARDCGKKTN